MDEKTYTITDRQLLSFKRYFECIIDTIVQYDLDHEEMLKNCIRLHIDSAKDGLDLIKRIDPNV